MKRKESGTIDEYIEAFPESTQAVLRRIRGIIRKAAPRAEEKISYRMPGFRLDGRYLMYFAAFRDHVSLYPIPAGSAAFRKELRPYVKGKGTIRFPLDRPVPYGLVKKVAMHHVKEHRPGQGYGRSSAAR